MTPPLTRCPQWTVSVASDRADNPNRRWPSGRTRINHPAISDALSDSVGQRPLPALDASAIPPEASPRRTPCPSICVGRLLAIMRVLHAYLDVLRRRRGVVPLEPSQVSPGGSYGTFRGEFSQSDACSSAQLRLGSFSGPRPGRSRPGQLPRHHGIRQDTGYQPEYGFNWRPRRHHAPSKQYVGRSQEPPRSTAEASPGQLRSGFEGFFKAAGRQVLGGGAGLGRVRSKGSASCLSRPAVLLLPDS
jgi:hypothetical protein